MMKLLQFSFVLLILITADGLAAAQPNAYTDPERCVAEIGALDRNLDGYISGSEIKGRGTIAKNVDTDGDGLISETEMSTACRSRIMEPLKRTIIAAADPNWG